MPPKKRGTKASTKAVKKADDPAAIAEKARQTLVSRAQGNLLSESSKALGTKSPCHLPSALARADGADILKKNTRRHPKYLLIFPGHFAPSPGAQVGKLRALDSRTPTLDVTLSDSGVLRFQGALVFPRNALLTVRGGRGKVTVEDVFETLLVFPEWAWIGDPEGNPGAVPVPFPSDLRKQIDTDPAFAAARIAPVPRAPKLKREPKEEEVSDDVISLDDDDDDEMVGDSMNGSQPSRVQPKRNERGSVDYSKMFAENDDDEDEEEEAEAEAEAEAEEGEEGEGESEEKSSSEGDTKAAAATKVAKVAAQVLKPAVNRNVDLSADDVIEIDDELPLPLQRRKRKKGLNNDDDSNSEDDEKPMKRVAASKSDSSDDEFQIDLENESESGTQPRRSSLRARKRVQYKRMVSSDEDDEKDGDASVDSDAMEED